MIKCTDAEMHAKTHATLDPSACKTKPVTDFLYRPCAVSLPLTSRLHGMENFDVKERLIRMINPVSYDSLADVSPQLYFICVLLCF
jgi:hypothetical protein